MKEAIKLAVTLHTRSSKLQAEIIAQDMTYEKMVEKARAIELTKKEVEFMKQGEDSFKVDSLRNSIPDHNRFMNNPSSSPGHQNRGRGSVRRNSDRDGGRGYGYSSRGGIPASLPKPCQKQIPRGCVKIVVFGRRIDIIVQRKKRIASIVMSKDTSQGCAGGRKMYIRYKWRRRTVLKNTPLIP